MGSEELGLRIDVVRDGSIAIVRFAGEIDFVSAKAGGNVVEQLPADIKHMVLDLSGVTFCDAAGVRFLLTIRETAMAAGVDVAVRHPSKVVRRILQITGNPPLI